MPYVHALRFAWATPLYDPMLRLTLREDIFRPRLVARIDPQPGQRVLDVGCGTGTLAIALKLACPEAEVSGLDGDPQVLAIAKAKAEQAGVQIRFVEGLADTRQFEPGSFDIATSSLVFHHLTTAQKAACLSEVAALLRPGGRFVLADFGEAHNPLERLGFLGIQLLDGFGTTEDNVLGRLPAMMREAGFVDAAEVDRIPTIFGGLSIYVGTLLP